MAGLIALVGATLWFLAALVPYAGDYRMAGDAPTLWPTALTALVLAVAGILSLFSTTRTFGLGLLVGATVTVFPRGYQDTIGWLQFDLPLGIGWVLEKLAFLLAMAGGVLAGFVLARDRRPAFGWTPRTAVYLGSGAALATLFVVARVLPAGWVTLTSSFGSDRFEVDRLFEDGPTGLSQMLVIAVILGLVCVAALARSREVRSGLLAGWTLMIVPEIVHLALYMPDNGPWRLTAGFFLRVAAVLGAGALAVVLGVLRDSDEDAEGLGEETVVSQAPGSDRVAS